MRDNTARFGRHLQAWWADQLRGASYPSEWRHGRDADAIAAELLRDRSFEVAQAAFLHRRPDAATARDVVDRLVPAPTEEDAIVLTAALVRAGSGARTVRTTTAAGAVLTVFALVLRNILRGR